MKLYQTHRNSATDRMRIPPLHLRRRTRHRLIALFLALLVAAPFPLSLTAYAEGVDSTDTASSRAAATPFSTVKNPPFAEETSTDFSTRTSRTPPTAAELPPPPVSGGRSSRVTYPYPWGAMAVTLYKDGKRVLAGQVADIGGTVYVPVQRFADLFGQFHTTYTAATEEVVIRGENLTIHVKVGDPYLTVNGRILYTGDAHVLSLGGWIFVPMTAMCRALNAHAVIRAGYYDAFITSGDPTSVPTAAEVYDSTNLYWLSRIISAEARGESLKGQVAVGNVVLNRVRSSQFPNTVKGVIFDRKYGTQFAPAANGTVYLDPTPSAVMAAKICLEGYSLSDRMLYFFNPAISTSTWISRTRPYVMTIGNHKFYA